MKILSALTSLTCEQVSIASSVATIAGIVGCIFAQSRMKGIELASERAIDNDLKNKNTQEYANYSKLLSFSWFTACIGVISTTGVNLKRIYNWYRS